MVMYVWPENCGEHSNLPFSAVVVTVVVTVDVAVDVAVDVTVVVLVVVGDVDPVVVGVDSVHSVNVPS